MVGMGCIRIHTATYCIFEVVYDTGQFVCVLWAHDIQVAADRTTSAFAHLYTPLLTGLTPKRRDEGGGGTTGSSFQSIIGAR